MSLSKVVGWLLMHSWQKYRISSYELFGFFLCHKMKQTKLTVFFNLATGFIFIPAIIAINELKFPMFIHSLATSIKYSTSLTRFFFFKCCKRQVIKKYKFLSTIYIAGSSFYLNDS
jgi:hypothetical protein